MSKRKPNNLDRSVCEQVLTEGGVNRIHDVLRQASPHLPNWLTVSQLPLSELCTHTHTYFSVIRIRNPILIASLQLQISRGFIPKGAQLYAQVLHGRGRSQYGHTRPELE